MVDVGARLGLWIRSGSSKTAIDPRSFLPGHPLDCFEDLLVKLLHCAIVVGCHAQPHAVAYDGLVHRLHILGEAVQRNDAIRFFAMPHGDP